MTKLQAGAAFVFLCWGTVSAPIRAQEVVAELDPASTHVDFSVGSTLHTVHGSFKVKSGAVHFDAATNKATGEVVVDATSGDSGDKSRDKKMDHDVLETGKYPTITFRPDRVIGEVAPHGTSHVQVHGIFNIHGADHEVMIPVEVHRDGDRPSVTLRFQIPYVKWGMKNPGNFFLSVDNHVEITIEAVGRVAGGIP